MNSIESLLEKEQKNLEKRGQRIIEAGAQIAKAVLPNYDNFRAVEVALKFDFSDDAPVTLCVYFFNESRACSVDVYQFYSDERVDSMVVKGLLRLLKNKAATMADVEEITQNL